MEGFAREQEQGRLVVLRNNYIDYVIEAKLLACLELDGKECEEKINAVREEILSIDQEADFHTLNELAQARYLSTRNIELQRMEKELRPALIAILGCMPVDDLSREEKLTKLDIAEQVMRKLTAVEEKLKTIEVATEGARWTMLPEGFEWQREHWWRPEINFWKRIFEQGEEIPEAFSRDDLEKSRFKMDREVDTALRIFASTHVNGERAEALKEAKEIVRKFREELLIYGIQNGKEADEDPFYNFCKKQVDLQEEKILRSEKDPRNIFQSQ